MVNKRNLPILFTLLFAFSISVYSQGDPYTWPAYNPTIYYNFKDENPNFQMPTKDLNDITVAGTQSSGWWTFKWGPKKNKLVTEAAITPLLAQLNKDFTYFRDVMGWPPDKRAQRGYRSAVYLYGSGLATDNASDTAKGGWQGSIFFNGENWAMILASYYPVYSFDPSCPYTDKAYQTGGMTHEGIHCVLADLPGCKDAAWFHEGGNTWLQQQAGAQQSGKFADMGDLNGCTFIAPFMPIECYSGWLQDGSFGGPSAEGVNKSNGSQQICTWRNYLGGNQYGNGFPTFLGEWLGLGAIPWIWKNCPSRVLEGIAAKLGDVQIRRLISEYRAKQALIDMRRWSNAFKVLMNAHFGENIKAEWEPYWINCEAWKATPYAKTTNDGSGLLTPEQRTTPGWSGANQIPLTVSSGSKLVTVNFQPIGANMTCQLAYRASDGSCVYSTPVTTGDCSLRLDKAPGKGVVIAVICNTDYVYKGEDTRKAHYDYKLKIVAGISGAADINTKWFDVALPTTISEPDNQFTVAQDKRNFKVAVSRDGAHRISVQYNLVSGGHSSISLYTPAGKLVGKSQSLNRLPGSYSDKIETISGNIPTGFYIIQLETSSGIFSKPVILSN